MSKSEKLAAKILSGKSDKNFAFNDLCYFSNARVFDRALEEEVTVSTTKKESSRSRMCNRGTEKRNRTK